jgi:hypothetical protein
VVLCLGLVIAGLMWSNYKAVRYFAYALAQGRTQETVEVNGVRYDVENGVVMKAGESVRGLASWRALKLAYEVSLARRDPFFNIAGTDPEELKAQTALLAQAEQKYASLQKTSASSTMMLSLYPISFLDALSGLEENREALLAHPSEENAQIYEAALSPTANAKAHDLEEFQKAFSQAVPDPKFTIDTYSGLLTGQNQLATISMLEADAAKTAEQITIRNDCLDGLYFECSDTLKLPALTLPPQTPTSTPLALQEEVIGIWKDAERMSGIRTRETVQLAQSACLSALQAPYDVRVIDQDTDTGTILELTYADNIYFTPTNIPNAPFLAYLRTQLGMDYTPDNTFKYYTCPQIGIDVGSVVALEAIAAFAQAHPDIAPAERTRLLNGSGSVSEYAALSYLNDALEQMENETDQKDLHALEEVALMEKGRSGGLDELLKDIVQVAAQDTDPKLQADMDTSARTIFATHSAFPSLYRIGASDPDVLSSLYIQTPAAKEALLAQLVPYSTLRFQVPRSDILDDLRKFLILEGRYQPSNAPNSSPATMSATSSATP